MIMNHPQALAQLFVHRGGFVQRNKIETPVGECKMARVQKGNGESANGDGKGRGKGNRKRKDTEKKHNIHNLKLIN